MQMQMPGNTTMNDGGGNNAFVACSACMELFLLEKEFYAIKKQMC